MTHTIICMAISALWDKRLSTVSIPAALATETLDNPSDPEIIESACYSRLAEAYMISKYEADEDYWAKVPPLPIFRQNDLHTPSAFADHHIHSSLAPTACLLIV